VVILDEIDQLEEDKILYDLFQEGVGLILISNSETALYQADPRIRSRLAATENTHFPPYSLQDLVDILKDRVDWGLIPGAVAPSQLETIASLSRGDARVALGILSLAAQKAEEQDLEKIPTPLIETSFPQFQTDSRKQALEKLTPPQRATLDLLQKGPLKSGDLYSLLSKKSGEKIVERTFRKQMERLVRLGLVSYQGEGRWRVYTVK